MQKGLPDRDLSVKEMDSALQSRDVGSFICVDSRVQSHSGKRISRQINEGIHGIEKGDYDKKGVYSADQHHSRMSASQSNQLELS
jgi:hypothetical protein